MVADVGAVDVHTHAIPPGLPDLTRYPGRWPSVEPTAPDRARILLGGELYREVDDRCWSAARRLRDMDAEGVAVQVVSPTPVTFCHDQPADGAAALAADQNEFLAGLVAEAPDRFRALGAVPLQDVERAVAELCRCVDELGFCGVEIGTRAGDVELCDPVLAPFFAAAAERGALVLVHPVDVVLDPRPAALGVAFGLGMPVETATAAAGLVTSRTPLPDVRICLAHAGGALPSILGRLDRGMVMAGRGDEPPPSRRARSLLCDSLAYDRPALDLAVSRFGADHVVLGTDYPFAAREAPPGAVLDGLPPDTADAIRAANARRLLAAVRPQRPAGSR